MCVFDCAQRVVQLIVSVATLIAFNCTSQASVLYSIDFENAAVGKISPPALGFSSGFGGTGDYSAGWVITADEGMNNSKGFNAFFDSSDSPFFTMGFNTFLPASNLNPIGSGSVSTENQLLFSMDVKVTGSLVSTPVVIALHQFDGNYEADRGIDANLDGDMSDGATVFRSFFTPTLVDGSEFVRVSFTLDQGNVDAVIFVPGTGFIPITPMFDPTLTLNFGVSFGSDGFGSDIENAIMFDNISLESVPEPSILAMTLVAMVAGGITQCARSRRPSFGCCQTPGLSQVLNLAQGSRAGA